MDVTVEYLKGIFSHIKVYSSVAVKICEECVKIVVVEPDESVECEKCDRFVCPGCGGLSFCDGCGYFFCEKCTEEHECEAPKVKQYSSDSGSEVDLCGEDDVSETDEDMTEEYRVYEPEEIESEEDDEHFSACSSEPDEFTTVGMEPDRICCDVLDYSDSEESE
jgi:hypothetical protein